MGSEIPFYQKSKDKIESTVAHTSGGPRKRKSLRNSEFPKMERVLHGNSFCYSEETFQ